MKTAEIYKLRTHRTPTICAAALLVGVLIPSVVLIWYTPTDPSAYSTGYSNVFETLSLLLGIVFGGWILGTEYRQGTVKRLLASEPRRAKAIGIKAAVGAGAMSAVLAATAGVGWAAARVVGSMNDVTVPWEGRSFLAFGISALIAASVAYGLSAITRSDSFAMVGTVALILVFGPLLTFVPKVGQFTLFSALMTIEGWIGGFAVEEIGPDTISNNAAAITLAAWLVLIIGSATAVFARRDV